MVDASTASVSRTRIFISYARVDDEPPGEPGLKGFVEQLRRDIRYAFTQLGEPWPELWRDRERIADGDPFDPILDEGLQNADILLVVLSGTWLTRPYCRKELEGFRARFAHLPIDALERRIVIVGKTPIEESQHPANLPREVGYRFYDEDREDQKVTFFFSNGSPGPQPELKAAWQRRVDQLAQHLWQKAKAFRTVSTDPPTAPIKAAVAPAGGASSGRTVFLARPAADMNGAYEVLIKELAGRGYAVTPSPDREIPNSGEDAASYVDAAIAKAEICIHLLGEKAGFTPDGGLPIVELQLKRAAAAPLARLIWAPAILPDVAGDRNPQEVLARLQKVPAQGVLRPDDKLDSNTATAFVQFVIQHLEARPPANAALPSVPKGAQVYLGFDDNDLEGATILGKSLQLLQFDPLVRPLQGDLRQRNEWRSAYLRKCDVVILCWGSAADIWVRAEADEVKEWKDLRDRPFSRRCVVQLAPPDQAKGFFRDLYPKRSIDSVIDGTATPRNPEAIAELLRPHLA